MPQLAVQWFFFVLGHLGRIIADILSVLFSPFIFLYYISQRNSFFTKTKTFKTILITGGSSGIGLSLSKEFMLRASQSKLDKVTIIITGTNKKRLDRAIKDLESFLSSSGPSGGGKIIGEQLDVRNKDEMKSFIQKIDDEYKIDLIIANAGIGPNDTEAPHYFVSSKPVLDVNCQGVLNTILPIIPKYQDRKQGHIAVIGSIAGHIPLPVLSHYGATKAYIRFLCDDLRPKLKMIGNIDVSYVAPGYVATNKIKGKRPDIMSSEEAANIIVSGLVYNESIIMFPGKLSTLAWLVGSLNPYIVSLIGDRMITREKAVPSVGFFHEVDPNDEFGGEC